MAASSRTRSTGPKLHESGEFERSISPSGRLFYASAGGCGQRYAPSSTFASTLASPASSSPGSDDFFHHRSACPTRVNLIGPSPCRSLDSIAANRSQRSSFASAAPPRKTCMCSPTTHPGSFRCSLHKGFSSPRAGTGGHSAVSSSLNRLNARRSAMTNSFVRIGTVEGDWVKRALTALIRPSSHQLRRRAAFQPRPSRLSVMLKADDLRSEIEDRSVVN